VDVLEGHVASVVSDHGIGIGGAVVQELGDFGSGGAFGLGRGHNAEGNEHGGVDGASIVEEGVINFLEAFEAGGIQGGRGTRGGT
jgi:hypothetical protein